MTIDTVLSALRGSAAFVSSLFAFTGMYERKGFQRFPARLDEDIGGRDSVRTCILPDIVENKLIVFDIPDPAYEPKSGRTCQFIRFTLCADIASDRIETSFQQLGDRNIDHVRCADIRDQPERGRRIRIGRRQQT